MTGLDNEREAAALELCGAVQGLIDTKSVPDYMVDFLASRLKRLRESYGRRETRPTNPNYSHQVR